MMYERRTTDTRFLIAPFATFIVLLFCTVGFNAKIWEALFKREIEDLRSRSKIEYRPAKESRDQIGR